MMTSAQAGKHSPMFLTLLRITVTKMTTLKWWYSIHTLVSWKADLFLQTWVVLTLFSLQNHRLQKVNRNSNLQSGLMTRARLQISLIMAVSILPTWFLRQERARFTRTPKIATRVATIKVFHPQNSKSLYCSNPEICPPFYSENNVIIFMGRLYEDNVIDYLNALLTHCRATCCKRLTTDSGML